MSVFIEPHYGQLSRAELEDKFALAGALLGAGPDPEQARLTQSLADILREHTHPAYLLPLNPAALAQWVLRLLDCVASRGSGLGVFLLPHGVTHPLLVTNVTDVPYLVDSLQACLTARKRSFHLVCHPIFPVRRERGRISALGALAAGAPQESLIVMEVAVEEEAAAELIEAAREVLGAALTVARDRAALAARLADLAPSAEAGGYGDFWGWLADGNFLPFAYRRHGGDLVANGQPIFAPEPEMALGLALDGETPERFRQWADRERELMLETTVLLSPLLRREPLVCLGCRRPTPDGRWEEHEFFGLFAEKARTEPACHVPVLRQRIEGVLNLFGLPKDSHDYRKTIEIFNAFPKVELFFLTPEELRAAVRSLSRISRATAVRVIAAASPAGRGVTLLLVMPRDYYAPKTMARVERYLERYFAAQSLEGNIIRITNEYSIHHVGLVPRSLPIRLDQTALERSLTRIARPWALRLRHLLERSRGEAEGGELWREFGAGFERNYRSRVHPRFAFRDVRHMAEVAKNDRETFDLWGPFAGVERYYRLQFYSRRRSCLNELMPMLQNLGLTVIEEVDFDVPAAGGMVYIKSFALRGGGIELALRRELLLEALGAMRRRELENDYLNQLLVSTGLAWREIDVFRGYRNYFFQLGTPYGKKRVAYALINNPSVALLLYRYFEGRFRERAEWGDALAREEQVLSPLRLEIAAALQAVTDGNEDQILRALFNLIDSTVRTNFFVRRHADDYYLSFKINALGIIDMPAPRPLCEIYVHSATMEGIHLRGGRVARGGIRWSDRPDDFRTEILGLMKTQMTKNALIVPVGSKGGFVVKTPYGGREEGMSLAREAYRTLIRGLLDLTDNRVGDQIVRPSGIVAYDDDDPYLVVAADKGTAHLPDTANELSRDYGFWLDDAFASGGSQGYNHKQLGITARGAWECVKRHFRELGRDIQSQPFTVVGIGDMSGDVFGNGMLQSRSIRLLAAFDHRHIFLDPDPDPTTSFVERQRLYQLPRSSWDDYDRALFSKGGGVFSRQAKDIPLSPEVRRWLGVRHETLDPAGLIRLLLSAEVDLLWNGGIGTYVKATAEKHEEVGDRTNDNVRIDGWQLRAKVVGEGGNLGFTQRGRVEYALAGGRINTDAVDNSAGVDCSDHEVNLKILMEHLRTRGALASREARDTLLQELTDEVCQAVLANNHGQSLCLSLDHRRCLREVEAYLDLCDRLARAGLMDRRGEFLPATKEVLARDTRAFTRPELAILMAYGKMQIYQVLLDSDLPERAGVREHYLPAYFPLAIRERYGAYLAGHPLGKEITATVITNYLVDRAGSALVNALAQKHGVPHGEAIGAWLAFDQVLDGEPLRRQLYALDSRMAAERQQELLLSLEDALATLCDWSLGHALSIRPDPEIVAPLQEQLTAFEKVLGGILPEEEWRRCKARAQSCEDDGLPAETAQRLALLTVLTDFLPIVVLARETGGELYATARAFLDVRRLLGLDEMLVLARSVPLRDSWDCQALNAVIAALDRVGFRLTRLVLRDYSGNPEACLTARRRELTAYRRLRDSLRGVPLVNFHPLMILAEAAEELVH